MNSNADELIEILKHGDSLSRRKAAQELIKLGPEAADAIPALIEVLNDENFNTRSYAELALGKLRNKLAAETRHKQHRRNEYRCRTGDHYPTMPE